MPEVPLCEPDPSKEPVVGTVSSLVSPSLFVVLSVLKPVLSVVLSVLVPAGRSTETVVAAPVVPELGSLVVAYRQSDRDLKEKLFSIAHRCLSRSGVLSGLGNDISREHSK